MEEDQPQRRMSLCKTEEPAQPRRSPRQHGTARRTLDQQMARSEKDRLIKEVCIEQAKHPQWLKLDEAIEEERAGSCGPGASQQQQIVMPLVRNASER